MDLISKIRQEVDGLNLNGRHGQEHAESPATATQHPPADPMAHATEPERDLLTRLIAGSGATSHCHNEHGQLEHNVPPSTSLDPASQEGTSKFHLLSKITQHKEEREKRRAEIANRQMELFYKLEKINRDKRDNEGMLKRLKEHLGVGGHGSLEEAQEEAAGKQGEKHNSFLDKITGAEAREKRAEELAREEAEVRAELERLQQEKRENEGVLEKLRVHLELGLKEEEEDGKGKQGHKASLFDQLTGKKPREEEQYQEPHKTSFLDQFTGDKADKPTHQEQQHKASLLDQITGKAAEQERLRREEENKSAIAKFKDRLNAEMGGGSQSEADEDLLDKGEHPSSYFLSSSNAFLVLTSLFLILH